MPRTTLLVGLAVVVAVLGGAFAARLLPTAAPPGDAAADAGGAAGSDLVPFDERIDPAQQGPVPQATLAGFAGGPEVALAGYEGRPLVVNFWATWCAPCVEEMPDFERVFTALDGDVAFLGVNVQDSPLNAEPFAAELGISYDLAVDPRRDFTNAVGAFGMPTTLFVDASGTITFRHTGPLDAEGLRDLLDMHLGVDL